LPNKILLITGPANAGKTTLADAWARGRGGRCAHLSLDSFRLLIKSGYHDPRLGWNDEAQRQLDIARSNVASVAARFIESEIGCVIDDAVFPDWEAAGLDRWKGALGPIDIGLVALMPRWNVIRDRNAARDEVDRIPEEMLRKIYRDMTGWKDRAVIPNAASPTHPLTLSEGESREGSSACRLAQARWLAVAPPPTRHGRHTS
jgi:hypothetical protein